MICVYTQTRVHPQIIEMDTLLGSRTAPPTQEEMELVLKTVYNPLYWATLRNFTSCLNVSKTTLDKFPCNYPRTPTKEPITWECPPGKFCSSRYMEFDCNPGKTHLERQYRQADSLETVLSSNNIQQYPTISNNI